MQIVTIDDRDSSIIYSSSWMQGGSQSELKRTTTYAEVAGATATLQFSNASTISVWGTVGTSGPPPESSYTIDNELPVNFTAGQEDYMQYQVNFFASSVSPGTHTLVITTSVDNAQYFLDYIQVIPPLSNTDCPVVQGSPDFSKSSISSTAASNVFTQSRPESSIASDGKSSISLGGILGITIGCAACGGIIIITIYYLAIRRRKKKETTPHTDLWTSMQFSSNSTVPLPFPLVEEYGLENSVMHPPHYSKIYPQSSRT